MRINTMRFGEIEIDEQQIITFPWGLPGFPQQKKYIPIEYKEKGPICFLQSLESPELTFVIADPFYFLSSGYVVDIPEDDLAALEITSQEEALVFVVLTIREEGKKTSANLAAPIVINTNKGLGRQVILVNSPYNTQFILNTRAQPKTAAAMHRGM
ncbi:MAG: flagellar assembly protein FliW [Firmicutes bacterium HGW-Firmicutes-12]|jgi:flagellar assembly factor FliW|nr:MAG: flagellar assembly protein FliW [Firmicutes bacterium HGW-Firmicutes-12]